VHALVAYFDCSFGRVCLFKPISFSTGPFSEYTHWKQTVFYLREPITIEKGEKIEGKIDVAPNSKNPRDLDISL
ncbi:unnamed protein product, partial [Discosporangium mesarthrocarpum]